jgi:hypothetical protein
LERLPLNCQPSLAKEWQVGRKFTDYIRERATALRELAQQKPEMAARLLPVAAALEAKAGKIDNGDSRLS